MKKTATFQLTAALILCFTAWAPAQRIDYPRLDLTPARPVDGDNVTFRLVLGMRSNGCVPTYEDVAFKLDISPILIYPPQYIITLQYTEIPPDPDLICIQIPTEYGPKVELGQLRLGNYRVMVGDEQVGGFSVGEGGVVKTATISGMVSEDVRPTKMLKSLEGVKVYLQQSGIIYLDPPIIYSPAGEPLEGGVTPPERPFATVDSTVTGRDGRYSFTAATGKNYRLAFTKKGYQTRSIPMVDMVIYEQFNGGFYLSGDTVISTSLLPVGAAATVQGNVGTRDRPEQSAIVACEGCSVSVTFPPIFIWMGPLNQMGDLQQREYTAVTDKDGDYVIKDVPITYINQPVTATASKQGYAPARRKQDLLPRAGATINFILEKSFIHSNTVIKDGIAFTVATEKSSYAYGEPVLVKYIVTNNSQNRVRYNFTSGCQYDMQAADGSGEVAYRYMKNIVCTDAPTRLIIEPDESETMEYPAFYLFRPDFRMTITAWLDEHMEETSVSVPVSFSPLVSVEEPGVVRQSTSGTVSYTPGTGEIVLNLEKFQIVSVSAYTLDGRRVEELSLSREFPAGNHRITLDRTGHSGIMILRVRGGDFTWNKMVAAPSR